MTVPRLFIASAVAAGLAFGGAGVVMAASSPPSSTSSDDVPQASASPEGTPSPIPSQSQSPDDSPSQLPIGDDVPAEVIAGLSEIPQSAAIVVAEAAVGSGNGDVERAVLKIEDGRLVWDVRFASDSRVEVDALTGEVVKVDIRSNTATSGSGGAADPGDDDGDRSGRGGGDEPGDDHGDHSGHGGGDEPGDDHGDHSGRDGSDD